MCCLILDTEYNLYVTGVTTGFGDIMGDIPLIKYSPIPDDFILSTDAGYPDADGELTLSWEKSRDAINYTIFQNNSKLVEGVANQSLTLNSLAEGYYNYTLIAVNDYGNTSSNMVFVWVQYLPGSFQLSHNASHPYDTDGNYLINWSVSLRADNYSIYNHTSFIYEIDNNGTLVAEGLTDLNYTFTNASTGEYYYVVIAQNEGGDNMSNCIHVSVGRIPLNFTLSSDADTIDADGRFNLTWTISNLATKYSLYWSYSCFTTLGSGVYFRQNFTVGEIPESGYYEIKMSGWSDGTYYFVLIARNQYGNYTSNCVKVTVEFPTEEQKKKDEKDAPLFDISPYLPYIILTSLVAILILLYFINIKRKKASFRT